MGKEVMDIKVTSEIIPDEMNGCINQDRMEEGRDMNKI